jgi:tetratricopeptide (TPR) repeat protein
MSTSRYSLEVASASIQTWVDELLNPYRSLSMPKFGPLNAFGPPAAFSHFVCRRDIETRYLVNQRLMPPAFRQMLAEALFDSRLCALSPTAIPVQDRSESWNRLCLHVETYGRLATEQRTALIQVLFTLGYYDLILALIRSSPDCFRCANAHQASLAYAACAARYVLSFGNQDYRPDDLLEIADIAPIGSKSRFLASSRLLMYYGRFAPNIDAVAYWRSRSEQALADLSLDESTTYHAILHSRHWRAASFLPLLRNDAESAMKEIGHAEEFARRTPATNLDERVLARSNLYPVLQSKSRLLAMCRRYDDAARCNQEMLELDPFYSTACVDYASTLVGLGNLEEACEYFERGAILGPPASQIAMYQAGWCHAQMDRLETALGFYLLALASDEASPSLLRAIEELNKLGIRADCGELVERIDRHLNVVRILSTGFLEVLSAGSATEHQALGKNTDASVSSLGH